MPRPRPIPRPCARERNDKNGLIKCVAWREKQRLAKNRVLPAEVVQPPMRVSREWERQVAVWFQNKRQRDKRLWESAATVTPTAVWAYELETTG